MTHFTIIQRPGALGRKSAENGVVMIASKGGSILLKGERVHGETLTVDVSCSSGKDAYPTYAAAEKALRMKSMKGRRTKRIYKCSECGCYHFTTNDGSARKPRPYSRGREKQIARHQTEPYEGHSGPVSTEGFSMKRFRNNRTKKAFGRGGMEKQAV